MNAKTIPKSVDQWIASSIVNRLTLVLLLGGHLVCGLLIWFYHNPGLQSWVAVPIISGLVTIWLLARSND